MPGEQGELENLFKQINLRKLKILKFLSGLFLFTGLFAISLFILNSLGTNQEGGKTFATLGINITIIASMFYIYLHGAKRHQRASTLIAISFLLVASFLTTLLYEADNSIVYLLIVTAVLLTSIILSVRSAQILFGFSALTTLTLSGLHLFELDFFSFDRFKEDFSSNLMSLFFVWIITMIAKIGYDQIEHSYSKAIDYAAELEQTNKSLDRKVKKRSEQLEDSLKRQANAVYGAAVVGSITRPLLHDLATPLSSFGIALDLMKDPKRKDFREIHSSALIALNQINEIIINGRNLIRNKIKKTHFSPSKFLEISLQILQNEIQVNGITVQNNIDQKVKIFGSPNLFIRISTNIILNAIQELHVTDKSDKKIIISTKQSPSVVTISIEDSGGGISEENLEKIFEPDFSSKHSTSNLGFGLPFVRSTIREHFNGEIRVISEVGKFTRIELDVPNKTRRSSK